MFCGINLEESTDTSVIGLILLRSVLFLCGNQFQLFSGGKMEAGESISRDPDKDRLCDTIMTSPDISFALTHKTQVYKNPRKRNKWMCSGGPMIPRAESSSYMKLKNPIFSTVSEVYAYHSFRQLFIYNLEKYPVNSRFKIIGQFKMSRMNIPYVQGYDVNDKNFIVFLNMGSQQTLPKINEVVEVFGELNFYTVMRTDLPVIWVHFFICPEGNIHEYIYCLKKQRKFVPLNTQEVQKKSEKAENSTVDFTQKLCNSIISIGEA